MAYSNEYIKYKNKICSLLEYWKSIDEKICLWGIGRKTIAFLELYDPDCIFFAKLIDLDKKKTGVILPTGHKIESPDKLCKDDIIFFVSDIKESVENYMLYHISHPGTIRTLALQDYLDDRCCFDEIISGKALKKEKYTNYYKIGEKKLCKDEMVSVILPSYNGEKYLEESVESVLNQSYINLELIIVDDNSTDNTLKIATEYKKRDTRVRVIHNSKNMKLPTSLNIGFKEAQGKYYTWTSDDNIYCNTAFEEMIDEMKANEANFVFSDQTNIDEDGYVFNVQTKGPADDLLIGNTIGACFMYHSFFHDLLGGYDSDKFCAEDYDFWIKMYMDNNSKIHHIPKSLYYYRRHRETLTATKKHLIDKTTVEIIKKYLPMVKNPKIKSKAEKSLHVREMNLNEM